MPDSTDYTYEQNIFESLVGDSLTLIDYILVTPHMTDSQKTDCIRVLKMYIGTVSPHESIGEFRIALDSVIAIVKKSIP